MSYPKDSHNSPQAPQQPPPGAHNSDLDHGWNEVSQAPAGQHERQQLAQEAARHTKARKLTALDMFVRGIIFLVTALELLLALRFILRLSGANSDNTFASGIYGLSQPFVNPFSTLFISPTFGGSQNIFDVNLLVAMAAYLALLALFLGLVHVFSERY
ncbi:MAG: YggT family protein [Cyanobacteria bacterium P01_C01_bin.70]